MNCDSRSRDLRHLLARLAILHVFRVQPSEARMKPLLQRYLSKYNISPLQIMVIKNYQTAAMPTKFPWSSPRKSRLSIEGIEVVPGTGLEIAIDTSPEVVHDHESYTKPRLRHRKRCAITSSRFEQLWKKKPILWIGIGVIVFGLGISMGVVFAWVATRKGHVAAK